MEDGFQTLARGRIAEDALAHGRSIERAIGGQDVLAKSGAQLWQGGTARGCQLTGDGVGVDQVGAKAYEMRGNRTLAAADAGPGTDFNAVRSGHIAITPIHVDLTRYQALEQVASWVGGLAASLEAAS